MDYNNNQYQNYPNQPMYAQAAPNAPVYTEGSQWPTLPYKYCPARAIVSMFLGINGLVIGFCGPVLCIMAIIVWFAGRMSYTGYDAFYDTYTTTESIAFSSMSVGYVVMAIIYAVLALVVGLISINQGNKYFNLYQRPGSRMVKAGKITSIIGFVFAGLTVILAIVAFIIFASNIKFF